MSARAIAWAGLGAAVGIVHALLLWRSARQPASLAGSLGVLRILGVGALLALAALGEGLLPAALGWGLGFPSAGCALLWGTRR